jgi:hypothetical protein
MEYKNTIDKDVESEIQDDNWDCETHEWEYKKNSKECSICNKNEDYIDDPCETHIHNFSKGLFPNKPRLSVCHLCGYTQYDFESEDVGDEGFFDFTSEYVKTETDNKPIVHNTVIRNFKNKLPKKKVVHHKSDIIVETESVGKRYTNWKSKNPDKLSFIRKLN